MREAKQQVQRALLLDVVISESAIVLQLLARIEEALQAWKYALSFVDLGLD
jgi:hypothetical protein